MRLMPKKRPAKAAGVTALLAAGLCAIARELLGVELSLEAAGTIVAGLTVLVGVIFRERGASRLLFVIAAGALLLGPALLEAYTLRSDPAEPTEAVMPDGYVVLVVKTEAEHSFPADYDAAGLPFCNADVTFLIVGEGTYFWKVKAVNAARELESAYVPLSFGVDAAGAVTMILSLPPPEGLRLLH